MRKILSFMTIACFIVAMSSNVMAQGKFIVEKTDLVVPEASVPSNTVRDFQNQTDLNAHDVVWYRIDSLLYEVRYIDGENDACAIRYYPNSPEKRYLVNEQYYPGSIKDSIGKAHAGYKFTQLTICERRRKYTYEARVSRKSGFLFWKKETAIKYLFFDMNGKFIDEQ